MSKRTYDISMLVGTVLTSVGLGAQLGWPWGLMGAGVLVLAITLVNAARVG